MAFDPFYSSSPSDSGLLDGIDKNYVAGKPASPAPRTAVPRRDDYVAPQPSEVDASAPEESLRDVPLPEGFLSRLRGFVNDL